MKNLASTINKESSTLPVMSDTRQMEPTTATLIYVPLFYGGRHRGTSMGPDAVRSANVDERMEIAGIKLLREIELDIPRVGSTWKDPVVKGVKCCDEILTVCDNLMNSVDAAVAEGTTAITIGGDHSIAIGSISGASRHLRRTGKKLGLIWFDAHGDIHTPETTYNGNLHAMPLAVVLGKGESRLTNLGGFAPKVDGRNAVLIGISDLDHEERAIIEELGVTAFSMHDIDRLGMPEVMDRAIQIASKGTDAIHMSFDIDVIDTEYAPGVTTPARGGMSVREALFATSVISECKKAKSFDFVELNPANDVRGKTARLCVDLMLSSMGHRVVQAP